jgi:DNA-binding transcriptional MerR regulator
MTKVNRRLISAKDMAAQAGVSYAAINHYTDMGLLDVVSKQNRVRLYDSGVALERLMLISKLINEGYTLRVIAKILKEK